MNIEFYNYGTKAKIIVTCWLWEFRRYNRVVDAALFVAPEVHHQSGGGLLMRTVIYGKTVPMLRAFKVAKQEAGNGH
ncbi:hypothetical protein MT229_002846 [Escherichia coli]|uniref:hypothetical protein n=1 Tax=Escherichia coli TaxID=562 RepID=UPI000BB60095|nr:hypothetical protein [Escherichia coli]EEV6657369.1 hypothetical protein [Escherichia coli]EFB9636908.1 hypothetical protein [Escherichia coli]EGB9103407.1 hypothetical protein [Escherichia coli]EHI0994085.1 hypothetical protein [Escherichia coli]EHN3636938.1 hypothetical protein [Escherichia coli]